MLRRAFVAGLALLAVSAAPVPQGRASPGKVRVRLVTSMGAITVALDAGRAPKTVANFLAYVDDGRFEGTTFYRTARRKTEPTKGFIQGGVGTDARRMLDPLPLEPTSKTGLRHLHGTISMAHGPNPNSANGNFSIMVGDNPGLDARGANPGFAAFGQVVGGMDVVQRILALPSGGGRDAMKGQMILKPVTIVRAERLDGVARPTGRVKPWQLGLKPAN
ncbi:peptidylprolyl isomerase [Sphingomonas pokkalii]|uniref:peptidylprolyl isomerase n=1 Tax=Sphingomonas pokkalii TaxID=2175090 RepID=A0A2U0SCV0_9SPHN|nr:peptidylprolyl isomerase [Sphingomonas pokkalii]